MGILLIVSIVLLAAGLVFLVTNWSRGWEHSFSQHAAQTPGATVYYAVLFVLVLVPLNAAMFAWFVPTFHVSVVAGWLIVAASALQMACALLPERGKTVNVHRRLAGASAMLLLPCLWIFFAGDIGVTARLSIIAATVIMIGCIVWLLLDKQGRVPYGVQALYYAAFFAPLLIAAA